MVRHNMPKKPTTPEATQGSVLVSATKSQKVPKLVKKDKHRLPRKQKKALAKKSTPAA